MSLNRGSGLLMTQGTRGLQGTTVTVRIEHRPNSDAVGGENTAQSAVVSRSATPGDRAWKLAVAPPSVVPLCTRTLEFVLEGQGLRERRSPGRPESVRTETGSEKYLRRCPAVGADLRRCDIRLGLRRRWGPASTTMGTPDWRQPRRRLPPRQSAPRQRQSAEASVVSQLYDLSNACEVPADVPAVAKSTLVVVMVRVRRWGWRSVLRGRYGLDAGRLVRPDQHHRARRMVDHESGGVPKAFRSEA